MADPINNQKTTVTTSGTAPNPNALAQQLAKPESKEYLDELDSLSKDPQYARGVPPDTQSTLKDAVAQAKMAYDARVSKNEWLEVAQTLGRAVAQFGAAQSGLKGGNKADMSNVNMGQPIDYNNRSDRAFREYQQSLNTAGDEAKDTRQNYLDEAAQKTEGYNRRKDYLSDALKTAREHESDDERFRRSSGMEKWKVTQENARLDRRDTAQDAREEQNQKKMELAELNKQESQLSRVLQARTRAKNNTDLVEDLSKKPAEKIQATYGKDLAEGDLNISDIQASKPGTLWGTNPDPEKTASNLDAKVAETRNLLDEIRKRKQAIISGYGKSHSMVQSGGEGDTTPPGKGPPESGTTPPPAQDSQILDYATTNKLDYEAAKKVLIGRGYKPAE